MGRNRKMDGHGNQSKGGKLRVGRSYEKKLGKADETNWNRNKTGYTLGTLRKMIPPVPIALL